MLEGGADIRFIQAMPGDADLHARPPTKLMKKEDEEGKEPL
jgi:hypothetical protein